MRNTRSFQRHIFFLPRVSVSRMFLLFRHYKRINLSRPSCSSNCQRKIIPVYFRSKRLSNAIRMKKRNNCGEKKKEKKKRSSTAGQPKKDNIDDSQFRRYYTEPSSLSFHLPQSVLSLRRPVIISGFNWTVIDL